MYLLKTYFSSENKVLLFLPIIVFVIAFLLHYIMVIKIQSELFANTIESVREKVLNDEKVVFTDNLIGNSMVYVLQIIGITISLNIGFLFFNEKVKFKKIIALALKSSIILTLIYLIIATLFYFGNLYTFNDLYNIETKFTLATFTKDFDSKSLKNMLEMFSLTQMVYLLFLSLGVKYLMNWDYKKAFLEVSKIYGTGFLISLWTT